MEVADADPRGAWVDTDDLNGDKNSVHYTRQGYKGLGSRFARKAVELIKKSAGTGEADKTADAANAEPKETAK
jgi:hypothetical protein